MSSSQYSRPVLLRPAQPAIALDPIPLAQGSGASSFDEKWLQDVLYQHPGSLPTGQIDPAYAELVPICRELALPSGAADILYATPEGRLVIVETKLWRNPEARRAVLGQILKYAKDMTELTYEALSRLSAKAAGTAGDRLLAAVKAQCPTVDERDFVDSVTRTLQHGRFLLLIVGDGIRENAHGLVEFLDRFGSLEFSFGLVEVGVYDIPQVGRLLQPRVLAKTAIVKRTVFVAGAAAAIHGTSVDELATEAREAEPDAETAARWAFYGAFWREFLADHVRLDDASQPLANAGRSNNIYFPMPPSIDETWLAVYLTRSRGEAGVQLRFQKDSTFGKAAFEQLHEERLQLQAEMGTALDWGIGSSRYIAWAPAVSYQDLDDPADRVRVQRTLADQVNRFVNVFRPRLQKLVQKLELA